MIDNYFRITCVQSSTYIQIASTGSITTTSIEYRTSDDQTWRSYTLFEQIYTRNGEWVEFRNTSGTFSLSTSNYLQFQANTAASPQIEVSGNVMSLLDYRVDDLALPQYAFYRLFYNVSTLTKASNLLLPAKTLAGNCYRFMFYRCSSLTAAPQLPATTLATYCYYQMFYGCSSLTQAPQLPATTLATYCYYQMFYGCSSLTQAPQLPATTLASNCYNGMFYNCSSLTKAPELPATTLAGNCYGNMFYNCSSLTKAPELPATTLATYCYYYMFTGCSSLTKAPELPAPTQSQCFSSMFSQCSGLSEVVFIGETFTSRTRCTSWLSGVSSTGTFYYTNPDLDISTIPRTTSGVPEGWEIKFGRPSKEYVFYIGAKKVNTLFIGGKEVKSLFINNQLVWQKKPGGWKGLKFENTGEDEANIAMFKTNAAPDVSLMYSLDDGETWNDFVVSSSNTSLDGTIITLSNVGDCVCFKAGEGGNSAFATSVTVCNRFKMTGSSIKASGNINSLLDGDNFEEIDDLTGRNYCFVRLFFGCTTLVDASELQLPATTLANQSYRHLFYGCTQLESAPQILPATTLATYCYANMFYNCSSLTQVPELPATTLASYCYYYMFHNCTSLTQAPELPATTLVTYCYYYMFDGCSSLTDAPDLPASTLEQNCYANMFKNCSSLNRIKLSYTRRFSNTYFSTWVSGVSSTGTFYYNGSDTTRGTSAIPSGWTIQTF